MSQRFKKDNTCGLEKEAGELSNSSSHQIFLERLLCANHGGFIGEQNKHRPCPTELQMNIV